MIKILRKKLGLVLTEALMTISILITCAVIAGGIFTNATNTTAVSKDFLIANGLALEGSEAVRNLVYTNKMLDPNDSSCWLRINPEVQNCNDTVVLGNYIPVEKADDAQTRGKWELKMGNANDLDLVNKLNSASSYLLYIDNVTERYTTSSNNAIPSKFYRSIKFLEIANDQSYATFEVKVAWFEGAKAWSTSSLVDIINQ